MEEAQLVTPQTQTTERCCVEAAQQTPKRRFVEAAQHLRLKQVERSVKVAHGNTSDSDKSGERGVEAAQQVRLRIEKISLASQTQNMSRSSALPQFRVNFRHVK